MDAIWNLLLRLRQECGEQMHPFSNTKTIEKGGHRSMPVRLAHPLPFSFFVSHKQPTWCHFTETFSTNLNDEMIRDHCLTFSHLKKSPRKGDEVDGHHHFRVLRAELSSAMLKLSGSLMFHSLRPKAINTIMCEGRAASVVLINLPTKIRSIFYSNGWGNVLMLTGMGYSASQNHTQLFNYVFSQHKLFWNR